jgi:hypothetical protein
VLWASAIEEMGLNRFYAVEGRSPRKLSILQRWLLVGSRGRDRGIALPVALVAALALFIGVAALASRTSQGFLSGFAQGVNREARDVAESAIAEFGVVMNREENRFLLVAGNDQVGSLNSAIHANQCTAFTLVDGKWERTRAPVSTDPSRFLIDEWQELIPSDPTRKYKVTRVEYLFEKDVLNNEGLPTGARTREPFDFSTVHPSPIFDGRTVRQASAVDGATRSLIRVTIVGQVNRNGQQSNARVAREFEVVPKCCKRSFGQAGTNWGRDNASCSVQDQSGSANGFFPSMNGGSLDSSGRSFAVRDENGEPVTKSLCWSGNDPGEPSDLTGPASQECLDGTARLGTSTETFSGVAFEPKSFSLKLPPPPPGVTPLVLTTNSSALIYFDPGVNEMKIKRGSAPATSLASSCSPDAAGPTDPYREFSCVISGPVGISNNNFTVDTSHAKINIHIINVSSGLQFHDSNTTFNRVHCPRSTPAGSCAANSSWVDYQIKCNPTAGNSDPNCTSAMQAYDRSELLNLFTLDEGIFRLAGSSSIQGYNLYAPKATIDVRGNSEIWGRLWINEVDLRGNVTLRVPDTQPSFCNQVGVSCPPLRGLPLFDVVARSFSHASGF